MKSTRADYPKISQVVGPANGGYFRFPIVT